MTSRWRASGFALLCSLGVAACTEVSTDPQVPVSLQFDSLPAQAVVVGDTMRGADLLPARLPVRAFSGSGSAVGDSQLRVVGIDSTSVKAFSVIGGLRLLAKSENAAVRIVAQAGALQSQTQTFTIVARPTALRRGSSKADTIVFDRSDTSQRETKVTVALVRKVADSTESVLNGLRVKFRVVSFTAAVLDSVRLVDTDGRNSTSALMSGGLASMRVKTYAKANAPRNVPATVVVEASHRVFGTDVPGSPLQLSVTLVPFTLP